MNVNQKIMAKYTKKSKNYEAYFDYFLLRGESSIFFVIEISCFTQGEKFMAKSINILAFIGTLQFNQMHLIFEINIATEIKKMIARNFNEILICSI